MPFASISHRERHVNAIVELQAQLHNDELDAETHCVAWITASANLTEIVVTENDMHCVHHHASTLTPEHDRTWYRLSPLDCWARSGDWATRNLVLTERDTGPARLCFELRQLECMIAVSHAKKATYITDIYCQESY